MEWRGGCHAGPTAEGIYTSDWSLHLSRVDLAARCCGSVVSIVVVMVVVCVRISNDDLVENNVNDDDDDEAPEPANDVVIQPPTLT